MADEALTCKHCGKFVSEGIGEDCYGSKSGHHEWVQPAAAPTPVEPTCKKCNDTGFNEPGSICTCWDDEPAEPAESQGVERAQPVEPRRIIVTKAAFDSLPKDMQDTLRAQPVEGLRLAICPEDTTNNGIHHHCVLGAGHIGEHVARLGKNSFHRWSTPAKNPSVFPDDLRVLAADILAHLDRLDAPKEDWYRILPEHVKRFRAILSPALVEGVERVTDDAPARVEPYNTPLEKMKVAKSWMDTEYVMDDRNFPAAQPAKHTDDRPAETIPGYVKLHDEYMQSREPISFDQWLAERTGHAETRIEVLEAALGDAIGANVILAHDPTRSDLARRAYQRFVDAGHAALAEPSGEKEKI